jgi:hypothetical protein
MEGRKVELLHRIESDREVLLDFLRGFIRCPSPNPPGDTREAADHIRQFLEQHGAECRVIAPNEVMPNIVATFEAGKLGRHLALVDDCGRAGTCPAGPPFNSACRLIRKLSAVVPCLHEAAIRGRRVQCSSLRGGM